MSARNLLLSLCLISLLAPTSAFAATKSGASKTTAHRKVSAKARSSYAARRHAIGSRLVPPPPAYMPSILPELYYRGPVATEEEEEEEEIVAGKPTKPKNPYVKYFYSRDNSVPKAVQARSGVTTWSQLQNGSGVTSYPR